MTEKTTARRRRNIRSWLMGSVLALALSFTAIVLLTPLLINLETVRHAVEKNFSAQTGGRITLGKIGLAYLPRPHAVISKAKLVIPESFTITIEWMKIYPRLLPLLQGHFEPALIKLEYADYSLTLPPIEQGPRPPDKIQSAEKMVKTVIDAVRALPEFKLPQLKMRIKYGKIRLTTPSGRKFMLTQLQARYNHRPSGMNFSITCKSNLWQQIDIKGSLNPQNFTGRGSIRLARFRPQTLVAYLFPDLPLQVTSIGTNLNIDFTASGPGRLTANVHGAVKRLELDGDNRSLTVRNARLQGSVQFAPRSVRIELNALHLDDPRLTSSAEFFYGGDEQGLALAINGSKIDAAGVRQAALALAGQSETVREIFNVVRGGEVPWITVRSRGKTFAELGLLDNIVIQGRMTRGRIFIPEIELDLTDVVGDATIAGGILVGDNLAARMGKTRGKNGRMKLGLDEIAVPFQLDIAVDADLSQLPPVLMRIVDDRLFVQELSRVSNVKGSATGILKLGDDIDNLTATVNVSRARFTASYERIPYPLQIDGGRFFYSGTRLSFEGFNVTFGRGSLSDLGAAVNWTNTPTLTANAQTARIDLQQLFSWLVSFDELKKELFNVRSLSGTVTMEGLELQGPFFQPQNWNYKTRGSVQLLVVKSPLLPEPLRIARGDFRWQPKQIQCSDVTAAMGKSTISLNSAGIDWSLQSPLLTLEADAGKVFAAEVYPWLSSFENFPANFKDMAISGELAFQNLHLAGPLYQPAAWQYETTATAKQLKLRSAFIGDPLTLTAGGAEVTRSVSPGAAQIRINVGATNMTWGQSRLVMAGEIAAVNGDVTLDMGVTANRLDWVQVKGLIDAIEKSTADGTSWQGQLRGKTVVRVARFDYETYRVQPLVTKVSFYPGQVNIIVDKATLCNLSFRGRVAVAEDTVAIRLLPAAADQQLESTLNCISGNRNMATGTYDLSGLLTAKSRPDAIVSSLGGRVTFSARKGRIYRFGLLAKILALLNVTEIYRGQVPDLIGKGFGYRSITASADIRNGKIQLQECVIDGTSMGIACEGEIDLARNKLDLIVLVAPFRTVDSIVSTIPLIGHILDGKLISIPFRASGDLKDPDVLPLPPTAVGAGVLGILERTLKLPITIIEPILPKQEAQTP